MKSTTHRFLAAGFIFALGSLNVFGQEYFSTIATPSDLQQVMPSSVETPYQTNPAERVDISTPGLPPETSGADKYNMALGPVHFGVAAGVGFEYNDNINLAPSGHKISDFAFRPSLTIDSTYQFSELNTLRFSLGASYAKYLRHSEFDTRGILLSPNSILAFTVHVSNVAITFKDRFSYQEDPFELPQASGMATYRRFENSVGIQIDWAVNEMFKLTGGYDHYNLWTFDRAYDSLQRSVDTFYIKPSYAVTSSLSVGVNASVSLVNFTEAIQNNGTNYMVGPFVDYAITQNTHLYAEAGYQGFDFDNNGLVFDSSNSKSWYARVDLANRLSENFSQRLSFTKAAEVGYGTNFYDLYHLEYAADWKITENLTLDPSLFYEHYKASAPVHQTGESADRYGISLGLRYILTPSITLGLDYRYIFKDSNLPNLDYRQNLVLLSAYYNF